jgi:hypothetical protein
MKYQAVLFIAIFIALVAGAPPKPTLNAVTKKAAEQAKVTPLGNQIPAQLLPTETIQSKLASVLSAMRGKKAQLAGLYLYLFTMVYYFGKVMFGGNEMLKEFTDYKFNAFTLYLDRLLHSAMLVLACVIVYAKDYIGEKNAVRCALVWAVVDFVFQYYGRFGSNLVKKDDGVIGTFVFMVVLAFLGF